MWTDLLNLTQIIDLPWLIAGDFNDIVCMSERARCSEGTIRRCNLFAEWVEEMRLVDLGFIGPKFTWHRGTNTESRRSARLDRGLCNVEWHNQFQNAIVKHLVTLQSNHCPLLIATKGLTSPRHAIKSFKFQAEWLLHDQCTKFIEESWNTSEPLHTALEELATNL